MNWIRRNWTLFSIGVLVFCAGWMAFTPPPAGALTGGKIPAPQAGFLAPDFTLRDRDGAEVTLSSLRGQPVLLNLWASWCGPCRAEMPAMQDVHDDFASQGFTVIAVNTTHQDTEANALAFADSLGLTFPILFDVDGSVSRQYQVRAMPTSFFIDREGIIRQVVIGGPMSEAMLRAEAERLLAEGR